MPQILLVNPWIADFAAYDLWAKPLGLMVIGGYLRSLGLEISLLDLTDRNHPEMMALEKASMRKPDGRGNFHKQIIPKPRLLRHVPRRYGIYGHTDELFFHLVKELPKPDLILITSLMTYWYPGTQRTIDYLKEFFPEAKYIVGGNYPTLMPRHAGQALNVDAIITGYGELKLAHLLRKIGWEIPRKSNGEIYLGQYLLPWDLYPRLDAIPILTSRGCPYRCSFCATHLLNPRFIQRKPENVLSELRWIAEKTQATDIAFYDDALFINSEKHIIPILEGIVSERFRFRFHTPNGLFPNQITPHLAELMKKANFRTIRLSLETNVPRLQNKLSKKVDTQSFEKGVKSLLNAGFRPDELEVYLIMGLPEQSPEDVKNSLEYVFKCGLISRLASYSPIPGTSDFAQAVELGLIPPDIDPLLLNNSIYPLQNRKFPGDVFIQLRQLSNQYNQKIRSKNGTTISSD